MKELAHNDPFNNTLYTISKKAFIAHIKALENNLISLVDKSLSDSDMKHLVDFDMLNKTIEHLKDLHELLIH